MPGAAGNRAGGTALDPRELSGLLKEGTPVLVAPQRFAIHARFVGLSALGDRYFIHEDWRDVIFDAMGSAAIGMTLVVFLVALLAGRDGGPPAGPEG